VGVCRPWARCCPSSWRCGRLVLKTRRRPVRSVLAGRPGRLASYRLHRAGRPVPEFIVSEELREATCAWEEGTEGTNTLREFWLKRTDIVPLRCGLPC